MRRTLIAGATLLLAGAGAASVRAVAPFDRDGSGQDLGPAAPGHVMNGSDTLLKVTQQVLTSCSLATIPAADYKGGGSGTAENAMKAGLQELGPMSRSLNSTAFCAPLTIPYNTLGVDCGAGSGTVGACPGDASIAVEGTACAMMLGLDGVGIPVNPTTACAPPANAVNNGRAFASGTYTPTDSFDTLALLYYGRDNTGGLNCNGAPRKALVASWSNILSTPCPAGDASCPTGLKHAWRRGDLSGTTDAFTTIVAAGAGAPTNPFCNANPTALDGRSDHQDLDPIRIPCDPTNEDVCSRGDGTAAQFNTLGLVLPVALPDVTGVTADIEYPVACDVGSFGLTAPGTATVINNQLALTGLNFACPDGFPDPVNANNRRVILGRCFQPKAVVNGVQTFACRKDTSDPLRAFGAPNGINTQVYNKPTKNPNGTYVLDTKGIMFTGGFYRIHSAHSSTGTLCKNGDDTSQIGCLTRANPCSVGFAGRESALSDVNGLLSVRAPGTPSAVAAFGPGGVTDNTNINNLLITGATPLYPLSRRLYVSTLVGYSQLHGDEQGLARCFANNTIVSAAISGNGFVPIPGGVQALDYNSAAPIARPPANTQGPGNVALAGCGAAVDAGNSCPAWAAQITP